MGCKGGFFFRAVFVISFQNLQLKKSLRLIIRITYNFPTVKTIVQNLFKCLTKSTTQNINYESLEDEKSIKFATCSTDGRSMIWKYSNECCVSIFLRIFRL